MPDRLAVSSADFIRNIGYWQNEAQRAPVSITHHGRERLVLATPDRFQPVSAATPEDAEARAALSRLRSDHASLIESLHEGFLAFDEDLKIRCLNTVVEAFAGVAREELCGALVFSALPQPAASVVAERLQRVQRSRKPETLETGSFDGRYLAVHIFPYGAGVALLFDNITERRVMTARLDECAALETAVRAHSSAAAIKMDSRARVETLDDVFCDWSGFSHADVVGHRFMDLICAAQRREAAELIERVLRECAPYEVKLTMLGKRGEEIPCVVTLAPILTDFVSHGLVAVCVRGAAHSAGQQAA